MFYELYGLIFFKYNGVKLISLLVEFFKKKLSKSKHVKTE